MLLELYLKGSNCLSQKLSHKEWMCQELHLCFPIPKFHSWSRWAFITPVSAERSLLWPFLTLIHLFLLGWWWVRRRVETVFYYVTNSAWSSTHYTEQAGSSWGPCSCRVAGMLLKALSGTSLCALPEDSEKRCPHIGILEQLSIPAFYTCSWWLGSALGVPGSRN